MARVAPTKALGPCRVCWSGLSRIIRNGLGKENGHAFAVAAVRMELMGLQDTKDVVEKIKELLDAAIAASDRSQIIALIEEIGRMADDDRMTWRHFHGSQLFEPFGWVRNFMPELKEEVMIVDRKIKAMMDRQRNRRYGKTVPDV